jgi:hypothetical protein
MGGAPHGTGGEPTAMSGAPHGTGGEPTAGDGWTTRGNVAPMLPGWTDEDQRRWDWLTDADPAATHVEADRLRRFGVELERVADEIAAVTAGVDSAAGGGWAAGALARCRAVSDAVTAWSGEARAFAHGLEQAADHLAESADQLVTRALATADDAGRGGSGRSADGLEVIRALLGSAERARNLIDDQWSGRPDVGQWPGGSGGSVTSADQLWCDGDRSGGSGDGGVAGGLWADGDQWSAGAGGSRAGGVQAEGDRWSGGAGGSFPHGVGADGDQRSGQPEVSGANAAWCDGGRGDPSPGVPAGCAPPGDDACGGGTPGCAPPSVAEPPRPGGTPGTGASAAPGSPGVTPPAGDRDGAWTRWQALAPDVRPGGGARLGEADGQRTDNAVGVRIAELPDDTP